MLAVQERLAVRLLAMTMLFACAILPRVASAITCGPYQTVETRCTQWLSYNGQTLCAPNATEEFCQDVLVPQNGTDHDVRRCQATQRTCADTTPTKDINGMSVPVSAVGGCWKWDSTYACLGGNDVNTCGVFESDPKCAVLTRQCLNNDRALGCLEWEIGYQCLTKKGSSHQVEVCGDTNVCVGGVCWDTSYPPDQDFVSAVTAMEIARQVGVYSPDGLDIFRGESSTCRSVRGAGLKNCCTTNTEGADNTNNAVLGEFINGAVGFAARAGSKFVLDTLYGDTVNWISSGTSAAVQNISGSTSLVDSISNPSFSYYGFMVGGGGTFLGTQGVTLIGAQGAFPGLYFNPYALAAAIAIQAIMSAMTCNEEEAQLALKRGANLCSPKIGDWCEKEVLGVCVTRKQSYCCYNSKFARIINVQGRAQLGMGWGDDKSPNCSGFNAAELKQIDFSKLDMSELVDDIMASYDPTYINADKANAAATVSGSTADWVKANCDRARAANPNAKLPDECK